MKSNYLRRKQLFFTALASTTMLSLFGCSNKELSSSNNSNIDILDTTLSNEDMNGSLTLSQEEEVNEESFKLLIDYSSENGKDWRVTDTKYLYISIKTKDLPENKEVYIDNIHTDTFIVSTNAHFDGIIQDTMDDRVHNAMMLGFPISNDNSYYGCNIIEGQNSEFMEGWSYGINGNNNGSFATKRHLESDFLSSGVYANRIASVIDLIIVNKDTNEMRPVSVPTEILVRVNNRITFLEERDKEEVYVTYEYDMYGNKMEIEVMPKGIERKRELD